MSPRTGRPPVADPNKINLSVRINAEALQRLLDYCKKYKVSKGEAVRRAIDALVVGKENDD